MTVLEGISSAPSAFAMAMWLIREIQLDNARSAITARWRTSAAMRGTTCCRLSRKTNRRGSCASSTNQRRRWQGLRSELNGSRLLRQSRERWPSFFDRVPNVQHTTPRLRIKQIHSERNQTILTVTVENKQLLPDSRSFLPLTLTFVRRAYKERTCRPSRSTKPFTAS